MHHCSHNCGTRWSVVTFEFHIVTNDNAANGNARGTVCESLRYSVPGEAISATFNTASCEVAAEWILNEPHDQRNAQRKTPPKRGEGIVVNELSKPPDRPGAPSCPSTSTYHNGCTTRGRCCGMVYGHLRRPVRFYTTRACQLRRIERPGSKPIAALASGHAPFHPSRQRD
jgi:hypothetical protein